MEIIFFIILLPIILPLAGILICGLFWGGLSIKEAYENNNITSSEVTSLTKALEKQRLKSIESHNIQRLNQGLDPVSYQDLFFEKDQSLEQSMVSLQMAIRIAAPRIAKAAAMLDQSILSYGLHTESFQLDPGHYSIHAPKIHPKLHDRYAGSLNPAQASLSPDVLDYLNILVDSSFWSSLVLSKGFFEANHYVENLYKTIQTAFSNQKLTYYVPRNTQKSSLFYEAWASFWKDPEHTSPICDMSCLLRGMFTGASTKHIRC